MKFYDIGHRSDEWFAKRLGKPTASQFGRLIGRKGELKVETAKTYECELIAERIFGRDLDKQERIERQAAVRYGIEHEDEAAQAFVHSLIGVSAEFMPGGYFTDDEGRYGASPDRRIISSNSQELVEIKCPERATQIKTLLYGMTDDYVAQVQGQLLISGYDAAYFVSYRHDCPTYIKRIERDPTYIAALAKLLAGFCRDLELHHARALEMGRWGE
jgi:hypothetical protein